MSETDMPSNYYENLYRRLCKRIEAEALRIAANHDGHNFIRDVHDDDFGYLLGYIEWLEER